MGEEIITRKYLYLIRLLVIIGISYLTLFSPSSEKRVLLTYSYIAFYLLTNLLLPYIPKRYFFNRNIFSVLIFFDSAMIAFGIYLSGRAGTDFYLIYFIIIGLASMSISLKYLMINTLLFTFLYGWLLYKQGLFSGNMAVSYTLRLPFMVIIALFFGYIVDTILQDKEKDLRDSEEKYRQLFTTESDSIIIFDADTGFAKDVNDAALELYGYSRKEFSKLKVSHILAYSDNENKEIKKGLIGNNESTQFQYHTKKDGTVFPVEVSAGSFMIGDQRMVSAVIRDVTKRIMVENELRESQSMLKASEKRLNSIVKTVPDIIYRLDTMGHVTFVNESIKKYGYSVEELTGRNILEIVHPEDRKKVSGRINERRTANRKTVGLEARLLVKDNLQDGIGNKSGEAERYEYFLIDAEGIYDSATPEEGGFVGTQGIAREITARKRLEEQFQQLQKMEALGTITSGVAHNFRNTLSGISINKDILEMKHWDTPGIMEIARRIDIEVKRGVQLIESLMQFSRKRRTDNFENINLVEIIEETYSLVSKSFDKRIAIYMDLPVALWITGEMSGLSQVFMNLCTNARDAMPDGGELHIRARKEDDYALVLVSDNGTGMTADTRDKCFDPFFTTKANIKGTGLGLSTAYGIIKDHGGNISVYSEINKGTTFKLSFPLSVKDSEEKIESVQDIVHGNGELILIVDDEKAILNPMEDLLERLGYRAISAESGMEALGKYKSLKPDAVLLDRNMPKMDGINCAERIIKYDPGARIVIVSGYDEIGPNGIDIRAKQLIKDYLTKPVSREVLSRVLNRLFA